MRLADLLTVDSIISDLKASDKEGTIREMVARLKSINLIADSEKVEKALMDREKLGSTAIGNNVAIPHAKCEGIDNLTALFAKSRNGVEFDSLDQKQVHYIFLLLAPKGEPEKHLKILARISRLYRADGFRDRLKKTNTPEEILETIVDTERSL